MVAQIEDLESPVQRDQRLGIAVEVRMTLIAGVAVDHERAGAHL